MNHTNHKFDVKIFFFYSLVLLIPFFISSCITVGIPHKTEPAENVEYRAPASPFKEIKEKTGDKTWISSSTGNSISYISDCLTSNDPTLDQLENESLAGIEKIEIIESKMRLFNARNSKETLASGYVDGVSVKIKVLSFKKNGCNFNLIFGGKSDKFSTDLSVFSDFVEGFKVQ